MRTHFSSRLSNQIKNSEEKHGSKREQNEYGKRFGTYFVTNINHIRYVTHRHKITTPQSVPLALENLPFFPVELRLEVFSKMTKEKRKKMIEKPNDGFPAEL